MRLDGPTLPFYSLKWMLWSSLEVSPRQLTGLSEHPFEGVKYEKEINS